MSVQGDLRLDQEVVLQRNTGERRGARDKNKVTINIVVVGSSFA